MSGQAKERPSDAGAEARAKMLRPQTVALLAVAVVFGLLLWAKLLLVTGHPRTALADPDEKRPEGAAQRDSSAAADELTSR